MRAGPWRKLDRWNKTISAERSQHEAMSQFNMATLSPQVQAVARKVIAMLNSVMDKELLLVLDRAFQSPDLDEVVASPDNMPAFNLPHVMNLASEQVAMLAEGTSIDLSRAGRIQTEESLQGVSIADMATYHPGISSQGGISYRFIVSPFEQMQAIHELLDKMTLAETTTCIPATESMGSLAVSESNLVTLPHLVTSLWRPSSATIQLAERLHSRVDIDWKAVATLLEGGRSAELETAAAPVSPIASAQLADSSPLAGGTRAMSLDS